MTRKATSHANLGVNRQVSNIEYHGDSDGRWYFFYRDYNGDVHKFARHNLREVEQRWELMLAGQSVERTTYERRVTLGGDLYNKIIEPLSRQSAEQKATRSRTRIESTDWTSSLFLLVDPYTGVMKFKRDKAHGSDWAARRDEPHRYGYDVIVVYVWEHLTEKQALAHEDELHAILIGAGCTQSGKECYLVPW